MIKRILSKPYVYMPLSLTPYIYQRFYNNHYKFELFDDIFIPFFSIGLGYIFKESIIGIIETFDKKKFIEQITPNNDTIQCVCHSMLLLGFAGFFSYVCVRYDIRF